MIEPYLNITISYIVICKFVESTGAAGLGQQ